MLIVGILFEYFVKAFKKALMEAFVKFTSMEYSMEAFVEVTKVYVEGTSMQDFVESFM